MPGPAKNLRAAVPKSHNASKMNTTWLLTGVISVCVPTTACSLATLPPGALAWTRPGPTSKSNPSPTISANPPSARKYSFPLLRSSIRSPRRTYPSKFCRAASTLTAKPNRQTSPRLPASLRTAKSGFFGYAVRILPHHPDAVTPYMPGLITWATATSVAPPEPALKQLVRNHLQHPHSHDAVRVRKPTLS
jgi:hypothetical protein